MPVAIVGHVCSEPELRAACEASTIWSIGQMISRPALQRNLYETGIFYKPESRSEPNPGVERFQTAESLYEIGSGDCDDLACVRAAQLRLQGVRASAVPIRSPGVGWHIVVQLPDGSVEDPSARLGMLNRRRK